MITSAPEAERDAQLRRLGERYAACVACEPERLVRITRSALEELAREARDFSIDPRHSPVLRQAQAFVSHGRTNAGGRQTDPPPAVDTLGEADLENTLVSRAAELTTTLPGGKPVNASAILSAGIQDITSTLVSGYQLNDLLNMIMETMYRGMGFARILIAVRDSRSGVFSGRFVLGEGSDTLFKAFGFPLAGAPDLYRLALTHGRDILITDAGADKVRGQLPDWYRHRHFVPSVARSVR